MQAEISALGKSSAYAFRQLPLIKMGGLPSESHKFMQPNGRFRVLKQTPDMFYSA